MELFLPGLFAALILVGIHAYLGLHVISRGIIFIDLAMAQAAALGYAFAQLAGYPPEGFSTYILVLLFTLICAAFFSAVRIARPKVPEEGIIGLTFAVLSAGGITLLHGSPHGAEHIQHMLGGQVLFVSWEKLIFTAILYATIGIVYFVWRRKFSLLSRDPDMLRKEGSSPVLWEFIFYATFGIVITSSVSLGGVLLVFTLLVGPAIFSYSLAFSFRGRLIIAYIFGFIVTITGFFISIAADLPTGTTVVLCFGAVLLLFAVYNFVKNGESRIRRVGFVVFLFLLIFAVIFGARFFSLRRGMAVDNSGISGGASAKRGDFGKVVDSPSKSRVKVGKGALIDIEKAFKNIDIKGRSGK